MYNNGQSQGNFGGNNQGGFNNGNGQMNPANPNGGYLKPGQRADQWYGNLTITPELLAEIQRTGKVRINVNEVKTNQYGPARRMTAKPFVEVQRPAGGGNQQGGNQSGFGGQPHAGGYNQAPSQPQQAPMGGQAPQGQAPLPDNFSDDIPF